MAKRSFSVFTEAFSNFNATASSKYPAVVVTSLYSTQKDYLGHIFFRFPPVPSRSLTRVTFVNVFKHKVSSIPT